MGIDGNGCLSFMIELIMFFLPQAGSAIVFAIGFLLINLSLDAQESQPGLPAENPITSSLELVPENAAFYWASFHNQDKVEALLSSQAFRELAGTTAAQAIWKEFQNGFVKGFADGWDRNSDSLDFQELLDWWKTPTGRAVQNLTTDAISQEVFVYGDEGWSQWTRAILQFYGNAFQQGLAFADEQPAEDELNRLFLTLLRDALADVEVPTLLLGGKIRNRQRVTDLLNQLQQRLEQQPPEWLADDNRDPFEIIRHESDRQDWLLLHVHSSRLPWQSWIDRADDANEAFAWRQFRDWAKPRSLLLGLGRVDDFLVFGVGPQQTVFTELGQPGHARLVDRERFRPWRDRQHVGRPSSLTWFSRQFVANFADNSFADQYAQALFQQLRQQIQSQDDSELRRFLDQAAADCSRDLQRWSPQPGDYLDFSFLTDQGIQGFCWDWSERIGSDSSRPLTLLKHADGNPAFMLVWRDNNQAEQYALIAYWINRAYQGLQLFFQHHNDGTSTELAKLKQLIDSEIPGIVRAIDATTRTNLIPAISGTDSAIIVDFKLTSRQWHAALPASAEPLALPGLAMLTSLNDAERFKQALHDYRQALQDLIDTSRSLGADIPANFQIPAPASEPLPDGTLYSYPAVGNLGLDASFLPNLAITPQLAVASLAPTQSKRLLDTTPLTIGGPLADTEQPLMRAVHYDNAATLQWLESWVYYAIALQQKFHPESREEMEPKQAARNRWRSGKQSVTLRLPWVAIGGPFPGNPLGPALSSMLSGPPRPTAQGPAEQDPAAVQAVQDLNTAELLEGAEKLLNLLKCFRSYTAASYKEQGAQVTHYLFRLRDIQR